MVLGTRSPVEEGDALFRMADLVDGSSTLVL